MLNFIRQCIAAFCIGTMLMLLTTGADAQTASVGDDGLVKLRSAYPVDETVARIKQDITAKGILFFQDVDQAQLANKAGIALPPSRLLTFGNPPLGAQFLTANPFSGLDWPVRVLVLQQADGSVWVAWSDFAWIARRHHITDREPQFAMATSVVESITSTVRGPRSASNPAGTTGEAMSAVLDPLFLAPPTAASERAAPATDGPPEETWILERCAREIALEAGFGARVVELGGRSSRGTGLMQAAIDARPREPDRAAPRRRRLVFVSGARTAAMTEAQLAATLRRVRELSPDDTLLVVGAPTPRCDSLARFTRLASAGSWAHRQLWSDGRGRFAVHVLARSAALSEEDAHVIET